VSLGRGGPIGRMTTGGSEAAAASAAAITASLGIRDDAACRAAMNSSASAKRSAGSFSSARSAIASSSGGTFGLRLRGGIGDSETCFSATVTADSASNGTLPVSSS
jgi:hypothetical protein